MRTNTKNNKNSGYMTVEAVFVFTSILIILFAIIYAFLLLYQNVVLMNAATLGAQNAAYKVASSQSKEVDVEKLVKEELKKGFFSADDVKTTVSEYGFLQPTVEVTLVQKIKFPMRNIAEMFGGEDIMTFKVSSAARVCDRPQNIRNLNLIIEIGKRVINKISDFGWGVFDKVQT